MAVNRPQSDRVARLASRSFWRQVGRTSAGCNGRERSMAILVMSGTVAPFCTAGRGFGSRNQRDAKAGAPESHQADIVIRWSSFAH